MLRATLNRLRPADALQILCLHEPSKCLCCIQSQEEDLNHIFSCGDLANWICNYFSAPVGIGDPAPCLRARLITWWLYKGNNKFVKFVFRLLPLFITWNIRKARNTYIFNAQNTDSNGLCRKIFQDTQDSFVTHFRGVHVMGESYQLFFESISKASISYSFQVIQQKPASQGVVKLNADRSSQGNRGISGGGGIVRDDQGTLIMAFSCYIGVAPSLLQVEARAMLFGTELCLQGVFSNSC